MDYEKKYKEALERAKQFSEKPYLEDSKGIVEYIFPELKESEDERIRKEMIFYFQEEIPQCSIQEHSDKMREFISWLKRQEIECIKLELKAGNSYFCYKSRWERADNETFKKGLIYKCNKDGVLGNFVIKNPEQHFIEIKDERIAWLEKQAKHANFRNKIQIGDKVTRNEDGVLVNLSQLNRVAKKDEKQGGQKPADLKTKAGNWYVCDMEVMNENMVTAFHRDEIYYCPKDGYLDVRGALFEVGCLDVFRLATEKEIPQTKQEWSEEEIENCAREAEDNSCIILAEHIRQLKSLRPQNTWKPSDEQIEILEHFVRSMGESGYASPYDNNTKLLYSLLSDLKKLKE